MIDPDTQRELLAAEGRLRGAMLRSDVEALASVLHDDYVFWTNGGQVVTKSNYLDDIRTGQLRLTTANVTDRVFEQLGPTLVHVSMQVLGEGCYAGQPFAAYVRINHHWRAGPAGWRLIGADFHILTGSPAG